MKRKVYYKMSRLRADLLLLLTAIIWGTAFIAQKTGMDGIGPMAFIGARFALSLLFILPFAMMERKTRPAFGTHEIQPILGLCAVFLLGVTLQHWGILYTSVTNAGFLTGLYVVFVPFFVWIIFARKPGPLILSSCLLAVTGVWFLNGGSLAAFTLGDWLVMGCALFFALHVVLLGQMVQRTQRPLSLMAVQYAVCMVVGLGMGFGVEGVSWAALWDNAAEIAYAGILSGGIAYSLQAVAQQYTPASDAAIILSSEALFAAIIGALMMGDRLDLMGWVGCAFILGAILLVELKPAFLTRKPKEA